MPRAPLWSAAEDGVLRLLWERAPYDQLEKALPGRSRGAMHVRARTIGCPYRRALRADPVRIEKARAIWLSGGSLAEVGAAIGGNRNAASGIIDRHIGWRTPGKRSGIETPARVAHKQPYRPGVDPRPVFAS